VLEVLLVEQKCVLVKGSMFVVAASEVLLPEIATMLAIDQSQKIALVLPFCLKSKIIE